MSSSSGTLTSTCNSAQSSPALDEAIPEQICGYPIDSLLARTDVSNSFLAIGPGGRGVVLKSLEDVCLVQSRQTTVLHPSVRERLSRVRELAHPGVANLYGVERDAGRAWIIWEYVPGQNLAQFAGTPGRSSREIATAARELVLAVETLHAQGIVHGALNAGNVIVASDGSVRLTHISPYLHTDPNEDVRSVIAMLEEALLERREQRTSLARLLLSLQGPCGSSTPPLRHLSAKLAAMLSAQESSVDSVHLTPSSPRRDGRSRRLSLAAAAVMSLLGVAAAYGAWHVAGSPALQWPRIFRSEAP